MLTRVDISKKCQSDVLCWYWKTDISNSYFRRVQLSDKRIRNKCKWKRLNCEFGCCARGWLWCVVRWQKESKEEEMQLFSYCCGVAYQYTATSSIFYTPFPCVKQNNPHRNLYLCWEISPNKAGLHKLIPLNHAKVSWEICLLIPKHENKTIYRLKSAL